MKSANTPEWKHAIRRIVQRMGFEVRRFPQKAAKREFFELLDSTISFAQFVEGLPEGAELKKFLRFCQPLLGQSHSQVLQDLFVLYETGSKRGGYFVEFGATNGQTLNNTYLLEKVYGWNGIAAEPARSWLPELKKNRDCHISTECVWHTSGQTLTFNETEIREFSTLETLSRSDSHADKRESGQRYEVRTISLLDLLESHQAPETIDYLSMDTEGSEYEILNAFDFAKFDIRLITVEHGFTPRREQLFNLLSRHGYVRKFEKVSQFDDWYVRE